MSPPFAPTRSISSDRTKVVKTAKETTESDGGTDVIVINFAKYFNAWKDSRKKSIVPLKYQFESTDVRFTKGRDGGEFLKSHLYDGDSVRTLYISHPPLNKKNRLSSNSLEFENVLIRINSSESPDFDILLEGNFESKPPDGNWEFMVFRMFFAQHCSRYLGETERGCRLILRLNLGGIDRNLVFDTDGKDLGRERIDYSNNVINASLVEELSSKYTVLDPKKTLGRLTDWGNFLDFAEHQSVSQKQRFSVIRPRAFHAYCGTANTSLDQSKILFEDDGMVWTEQPVPNFSQCIFVRLEHAVSPETDEKDLRKYISKFDAVTRGAPILMDPEADPKENPPDPEERRKERELSSLGERITESQFDSENRTITARFVIPVPRDKSAQQYLNELTEYYSSHSQLVIAENNVAAKASIGRQRIGIHAARDGMFANPLIPSFIDDPSLLPEPKSEEVGYYFGKKFNDIQKKAVNGAVFSRGLYLIQGPPGTGKTQVISEITAQEIVRGRKVLITSQGNKAVDNAFERLTGYGFVRPVRIMADRKENDFDVEHLVSRFYESAVRSIEDRIDFFGNGERRNEIGKKIAEFRDYYKNNYFEAAARVRVDLNAIRKLTRNHDERIENLNCRNAENRYNRNIVNGLNAKLERLGNFEREDYLRFNKSICDMLPFVPEGCNLGKALYGKNGLCARLTALEPEDVEKEQALLDSYVPENGSLIAAVFGSPLPVILANMRENFLTFKRILAEETEGEIGKLSDRCGTTEVPAGREESFASKLSVYTEKPEYKAYRESEEHLHGLISELFGMLSSTGRYETVEEAKRIIDREEKNLELLNGDNAAKCIAALEEVGEYLSEKETEETQKEKLREELTGYVNVIGATSTSREAVLDYEKLDIKRMGVDTVIVDEVSKVPFCELMYPLSFGKKVILVGDQKQLPPVYNENTEEDELKALSKKYAKLYTEPLFSELFDRAPDYAKTMLTTQYRMSGDIMGVINRFYGGALLMGCRPEDRLHYIDIEGKNGKLIDGNQSVLFVNCDGNEKRENGSTSFFNSEEAHAVDAIVRLLDRNCVCGSDGKEIASDGSNRMSMGVITPYKDQIKAIRKLLRLDTRDGTPGKLKLKGFRAEGEEKFMIKSVDDFQGDERDVIILSLVRTTSSNFISDFRRINVAMSRARRLLIIVGKAETLCEEKIDIDAEHLNVPVYSEIIEALKAENRYAESTDIPEVGE